MKKLPSKAASLLCLLQGHEPNSSTKMCLGGFVDKCQNLLGYSCYSTLSPSQMTEFLNLPLSLG